MVGADEWLNIVWSLALLKNLEPSIITTVLNNDFITNLMSTGWYLFLKQYLYDNICTDDLIFNLYCRLREEHTEATEIIKY